MVDQNKLIIQEPKKFFISFKDLSGRHFAEHLYLYLKNDIKADVFLSRFDLQYDMNQGEWRDQIDIALSLTKVFILIITPTASTSKEVKREFKQVMDNDAIKKYIFIHEILWNDDQQTIIKLSDGRKINLKTFHTSKFSNEFDLILKVYNAISTLELLDSVRAL